MNANFPDDFKTVRIFQLTANFPDYFKIVRIFPMVADFPDDFKTVRIFQMTANFLDYFKTVQICQMFQMFQKLRKNRFFFVPKPLIGPFYGLFGPFLALLNTLTPFLALLGENC